MSASNYFSIPDGNFTIVKEGLYTWQGSSINSFGLFDNYDELLGKRILVKNNGTKDLKITASLLKQFYGTGFSESALVPTGASVEFVVEPDRITIL